MGIHGQRHRAAAEEGLLSQNMRVGPLPQRLPRRVTNSRGPINSPADMNGLLIRTPENPVIVDYHDRSGVPTPSR